MTLNEIDKLLKIRSVKTIVLSDLITFVDNPVEYIKKHKIQYVYNNYNDVFINSCFVTREYIEHYENKYTKYREYTVAIHKKAWENLILIFVLGFFLNLVFWIVWFAGVIKLNNVFNESPFILITSLIIMVFVFYYIIKLLRDLFTYVIVEYAQFHKYL